MQLATSHAVSSAVQAIDLFTCGWRKLAARAARWNAFRDVAAMALHIAVQPRVMVTTGRVLFGLEPDTPLL